MRLSIVDRRPVLDHPSWRLVSVTVETSWRPYEPQTPPPPPERESTFTLRMIESLHPDWALGVSPEF